MRGGDTAKISCLYGGCDLPNKIFILVWILSYFTFNHPIYNWLPSVHMDIYNDLNSQLHRSWSADLGVWPGERIPIFHPISVGMNVYVNNCYTEKWLLHRVFRLWFHYLQYTSCIDECNATVRCSYRGSTCPRICVSEHRTKFLCWVQTSITSLWFLSSADQAVEEAAYCTPMSSACICQVCDDR